MDLSIFLARVIGLAYVVSGLAMLIHAGYYKKLMKEFMKNASWLFTMGFLSLIVSFIWILKHNVWEGWPILVTLFGWVAFLESLVILIFPQWSKRMGTAFIEWVNVRLLWGCFGLALGILFSYFGWMA